MGKYLARGYNVQNACIKVLASRSRDEHFPGRLDLPQSIKILSYDHRSFPFFFFLVLTRITRGHSAFLGSAQAIPYGPRSRIFTDCFSKDADLGRTGCMKFRSQDLKSKANNLMF